MNEAVRYPEGDVGRFAVSSRPDPNDRQVTPVGTARNVAQF